MNEYNASDRPEPGEGLLAVLRRRWIIIAACAILFPLIALFVSSRQHKVYAADALVLLNQANLANSLTDTPDPSLRIDRDRQAKTQVQLAQLPEIAEATINRLKIGDLTPDELRKNVTVTAASGTDILTIQVRDSNPTRAEKLATIYAHQYTGLRARFDTKALATTLAEVRRRLGQKHLGTDLRDNLKGKEAELSTLQTLQTRNSVVARAADSAQQVAPTPARDAALALILGLMVGCALALVVDSADKRVRDARQIASGWNLPLVGRIPPAGGGELSIAQLSAPGSAEADAYRFVVSDVESSEVGSLATLLVVSASDTEGRSRAAANLAVAYARAGLHVLAIDLDFVQPRLSELFAVGGRPGASDFAVNAVGWEQATVQIDFSAGAAHSMNGDGPSAQPFGAGTLTVMPSGTVPDSSADFAGSSAIRDLLDRVRQTFDRVVIDAPGVLGASDAVLVSRNVDGVLAIADARRLTRTAVSECGRILERIPAPIVGLVSTEDATSKKVLGRPARGARRSAMQVRSSRPAGTR